VAFFPPDKDSKKKRGRPPTFGDKSKLIEMFDYPEYFKKIKCTIYNRTETILITSLDLLWKLTGGIIRFVFAITSRGPIILMCSDITINPIVAIERYCARIRIETMFDMLKNVICAFSYHFWSKQMPRHSRKPKKNSQLMTPHITCLPTVTRCWDAIERFIFLGAISLGILQIISCLYTNSVWGRYNGFLRTKSRELPSERTVKNVLQYILIRNWLISASTGILRKIKERYFL